MKTVGVVIVLLALAVAIIPQFTDCQSQGRAIQTADGRLIPMKCHWTARAALGLGLPLAVVGLLMAFNRRKDAPAARSAERNLAVAGMSLGAVAILLPTALVGVCASETMLCNSVMRPALILGGTLVVVAAAVGWVSSWLGVRRPA